MLAPLAQAAQPAAIDPMASALYALGGGTGGLLLWQLVRPFIEAWGLNIKKRLGDSELEAKAKTRAMVHDLTERVADIVEQQRNVAEIQRQTLKELEEFRRETRAGIARIEKLGVVE